MKVKVEQNPLIPCQGPQLLEVKEGASWRKKGDSEIVGKEGMN